jgi:deoxyribodipyrimidine photolyase
MSSSQSSKTGPAVVWFRNDLRLHDNPVLAEAARRVGTGSCSSVLPLYCFDPRYFGATPWGHPKTGAFRAQASHTVFLSFYRIIYFWRTKRWT